MSILASPPLTVARTRAELAAALTGLPEPRRLVATMGALHAGHAALLAAAGPGAVLSIFVNPLQFAPSEDLDRYPRTWDADLALAADHGVAVVFAPAVQAVYPIGAPEVTVHAGRMGERYEGAARPGHLDGMLTVVARLFGLIRPELAYFGQKDAQQLALVRAMVRDLDLGVVVEEVPTVREPDGLALSSRNRYLSTAERAAAIALPVALAAGSLPAARAVLAAEPGIAADYCELVHPDTFEPQPPGSQHGRLILAATVGATRLIDNDLI